MPQTLTGWILITAVVLSGAGGGYSAARMLTTVRDGKAIEPRDIGGAAAFVVLLVASALMLWLVDGR